MYRLLLTILFLVLLRLVTLAEAAAPVRFPLVPDRSDFAAEFLSATAADDAGYVRGSFEPDYFDFTAKALRSSPGQGMREEQAKPRLRDGATSLPPCRPSSADGISLAVPLPVAPQAAFAWQAILPPQLNYPPYYATAPPFPR